VQVKQPIVSESIYAYKFKFENENALMASMKISNCFACEGDAHTIGEKLVKPCAVDLTACMVDK
jgi:methanogenic corrinoid protein MtbC1